MGVGEAVNDTKKVTAAPPISRAIAGQKPVITRPQVDRDFKVRENMPLGVKVTLRKQRMYEFLDRLVNIALPRVRDFRGLNPKSFDGRGNYAMGIKEHIMFPEINYDRSIRSGAWTSSSARRRRPTTKPGRCSRLSTSPSGSNGFKRREDETWQRPARSRRTTAAASWRSSTPRSAPS
jgi:hypothetical protein